MCLRSRANIARTLPGMAELPAHLARFHRQAILPGVGAEGQERLARSHAAIIGVGALGCVTADLLCRAGVGTLTLVDRDVVELTNLQRQTLFDESDVGQPKAEAAQRRLGRVNRACRVFAEVEDLRADNAPRVLGLLGEAGARPGVLIDGTDNFETRYLLNDLAVVHGVPYVYAGAVGTTGAMTTVVPGVTPCLRCLHPRPPEGGANEVGGTCDTAGIFGPASMIVAACQASDAIKVLLGRADLLSPTLLQLDLWSNHRRRVELSSARDPDCPCCARGVFAFAQGGGASRTTVLCGRNSVQVAPGAAGGARRDLHALAVSLRAAGLQNVQASPSMVHAAVPAERDPLSITVFTDGRTIVTGTTDVSLARSVHARYVGA